MFFLPVGGESDMDLDLLAESESDSESSHSNQDNASIQRSAVTAATAGSDAGEFAGIIRSPLPCGNILFLCYPSVCLKNNFWRSCCYLVHRFLMNKGHLRLLFRLVGRTSGDLLLNIVVWLRFVFRTINNLG